MGNNGGFGVVVVKITSLDTGVYFSILKLVTS